MAGTRTVNGGNVTYTFSYTGPTARNDEIASGAARALWISQNPDADPAGFDALTVQQKVNILDNYIAKHFTALATNNKRDTDVQAAADAAEAYAAANYGL